MYLAIFKYIDRVFNIIRPRRILYMAVDGVAPRAKMNQQRSRRFRSAKDIEDKRQEEQRLRSEWSSNGKKLPPEKPPTWDHNVITPGTGFMQRLSTFLRYYIHQRCSTDPGWKNVKVILSDASVPGEGEHKVMEFIRLQRQQQGCAGQPEPCIACSSPAQNLSAHSPCCQKVTRRVMADMIQIPAMQFMARMRI